MWDPGASSDFFFLSFFLFLSLGLWGNAYIHFLQNRLVYGGGFVSGFTTLEVSGGWEW